MRICKFHPNLTRIMCNLHDDQYTSLIISRLLFPIMRNISDILVEKIKTRILNSIIFFFFENRAVYEMEKCGRAGKATDDNMAHAHCMLDT